MGDKDLHERILSLLDDPTFVKWVKSNGQAYADAWVKYQNDHPEQKEAVTEARAILSGLHQPADVQIDKEALWKRIAASTAKVPQPLANKASGRIVNMRYIWAGVAAAVVIGVIFLKTFQGAEIVQKTSATEQASVLLPDRSEILLDAGSEISYNKHNWDKQRDVHLDGLAFFEVQKGKTFEVHTQHGTVTVLGTSFSVYARPDRMEVYCKTGKVSVRSNRNTDVSQILLPNEKVIFKDGNKTFVPTDSLNSAGWIDGIYTFSNLPVGLAMDELERQFDVAIQTTDEIKAMPYTGFFRRGDIHDALKSITWPLGLQYAVDGKKVTISK